MIGDHAIGQAVSTILEQHSSSASSTSSKLPSRALIYTSFNLIMQSSKEANEAKGIGEG